MIHLQSEVVNWNGSFKLLIASKHGFVPTRILGLQKLEDVIRRWECQYVNVFLYEILKYENKKTASI